MSLDDASGIGKIAIDVDYYSQYRFLFEPEEFLPDLRYNTVSFELNLAAA